MIGIVDYGLCNLLSVASAVRHLGHEAVLSNKAEVLARASKLILPGVGAFGDAMRNLDTLGLIPMLRRHALQEGKDILGICLGFQLLCESSDEFGQHAGLGVLKARVERFDAQKLGLRIPHMGWNGVRQTGASPMFHGIPDGSVFYFVHSHRVLRPEEAGLCAGFCEYGEEFCAAMVKGNIWGTQFHPEKSQLHGLRLLGNFLGEVQAQ